ncbi:hypothetical protein AI22_17740 [Pseudomonas aeruginosa YL84]|nr:hypothetical protein AI22_17740 [Pseudomonas aeruginosa YL84]
MERLIIACVKGRITIFDFSNKFEFLQKKDFASHIIAMHLFT